MLFLSQQAALDALDAYWQAGGGHALVPLATATGKAIFESLHCRRRDLIRRQDRWRQLLAQRQPHRSDLLQLGDDDFLSHAPEWLIASVTEFGLRHSMAP